MNHEEARIEVGAALRLLRKASGLRQDEAASKAGIGAAHLSSYENGRSAPTVPVAASILEALGADFRDLHAALEIVRRRRQAGENTAPASAGVSLGDFVRGLEALLREVNRDRSREDR